MAALPEQKEDVMKNSPEHDGKGLDACGTTSKKESSGIGDPGKLFILGDSLGVGLRDPITAGLSTVPGWSVASDVQVGRTLDQGIAIASSNPQDLVNANYALVVLGTNPSSKNTEEGINEMISALQAANPTVTILWLSVNVTRSDLVEGAKSFNQALKAKDGNGLILIENTTEVSSDGVHPKDYQLLAQVVVDRLNVTGGATTGSSTDSSGCVCSSGTVNIDVDKGFDLGTDPRGRRVALMQALINDYSLTPQQAAGPVGNFMEESGGKDLPPDVNEGGEKGPPKFSGGYGWAQWTGSRQRTFIDFAVENGYMESENVNANDAADYAYLKKELSESYTSTITELKKQTTPEDAAVSFEATFEKAGSPRIEDRKKSARQAYEEFMSDGGAASGSSGSSACAGSAVVIGDYGFPLNTTKSGIKNPGIFKNGTTDQAGHPYTAFDILADTGTPVVAFLSGNVVSVSEDKCPGRLISIYNDEYKLTISYLHMSFDNHISLGSSVEPGSPVGLVGTLAQGCTVPHLHIDAARGDSRPGCARENCPADRAAKFVDIGPQLFLGYEALPD